MTTLSQTPFSKHPAWSADRAVKSPHLSEHQLRQSYSRKPLYCSMLIQPMKQYSGQPALFLKRFDYEGFLLIQRDYRHPRIQMRKMTFEEWALYHGHSVN